MCFTWEDPPENIAFRAESAPTKFNAETTSRNESFECGHKMLSIITWDEFQVDSSGRHAYENWYVTGKRFISSTWRHSRFYWSGVINSDLNGCERVTLEAGKSPIFWIMTDALKRMQGMQFDINFLTARLPLMSQCVSLTTDNVSWVPP